jgi:hypothetical protein
MAPDISTRTIGDSRVVTRRSVTYEGALAQLHAQQIE